MDNTFNMNFLDVEAHEESELSVISRLDRVETLLATELNLPRRIVRKRMIQMVRAHAIDETAIVMEWLAAYGAATEYAERSVTDPPPLTLADRDPQGPQDAALGFFGVLLGTSDGEADCSYALRDRVPRSPGAC